MLYVLRLTSGDCIVAAARDENDARDCATHLGLETGESIATVRELPQFTLRFSPTEMGSLEVNSWSDATLDDILAHEYPALDEAFRSANSAEFMSSPNLNGPLIDRLRKAYERNTEIIRKGLRQEQERFSSAQVLKTKRAAPNNG